MPCVIGFNGQLKTPWPFHAKSNISFYSYFLFPIQIVCLCSCPPGTMLYCRQQRSFSDVNRSPACWSKNLYLGSLGLYVDNIIVVSASCHHCCWLEFSQHVGSYRGRQRLPHFTQCHSRLVLLAISLLERESDKKWSMMTSLCLWNEIHHYSFTSRSRSCAYSGNIMCSVCIWRPKFDANLFYFSARSVLCELASTRHCKTVHELFLSGLKQAKHFCTISSKWFSCHFCSVKITETVI